MRKLEIYIEQDQYETIRWIAYLHTTTLSAIIRWCINAYPECKEYLGRKESRSIYADPKLEAFIKDLKAGKLKRPPDFDLFPNEELNETK
jgi:hypothetical protein